LSWVAQATGKSGFGSSMDDVVNRPSRTLSKPDGICSWGVDQHLATALHRHLAVKRPYRRCAGSHDPRVVMIKAVVGIKTRLVVLNADGTRHFPAFHSAQRWREQSRPPVNNPWSLVSICFRIADHPGVFGLGASATSGPLGWCDRSADLSALVIRSPEREGRIRSAERTEVHLIATIRCHELTFCP
jgi:hypothetical protein